MLLFPFVTIATHSFFLSPSSFESFLKFIHFISASFHNRRPNELGNRTVAASKLTVKPGSNSAAIDIFFSNVTITHQ